MKFYRKYFILFVILFLVELSIALFINGGFIRHTFGDILVAIMMYCFIRSIFKVKPVHAGIIVLIISFSVELLQYFDLISRLGLENNKFAILVLGNTFQISDLIAYSSGIMIVLIIEYAFSSFKKKNSYL